MKQEKKLNQIKKILWVEDDYYHMKGLFKKVEERGFLVIPARSFMEAKTFLENWREFCIVVLDLCIPYSEMQLYNLKLEKTEIPTENGALLFNYMIEKLKVNIPILILSIFKTPGIINKMINRGKLVRKIDKLGVLPSEIEEIILDMLDYKKYMD